MKKVSLVLLMMIAASLSFASIRLGDSSFYYRTGWLVFRDYETVWVPDTINKNVNSVDFFSKKLYSNGNVIRALIKDSEYRAVAKWYKVYYNDSKRDGEIGVLPVRVRLKKEPSSDSTIFGWLIVKDEVEIDVQYKEEADYFICDLKLIRKSDKVAFRKSRKKQKYVNG
jgi:hypothetical protein